MQISISVALTWFKPFPTFYFYSLINNSKSTSIDPFPAYSFCNFLSAFYNFISSVFARRATRSASIFFMPYIIAQNESDYYFLNYKL